MRAGIVEPEGAPAGIGGFRERGGYEATGLKQFQICDCLGGCRRGGQRLLEGPNHIVAAVFPA